MKPKARFFKDDKIYKSLSKMTLKREGEGK